MARGGARPGAGRKAKLTKFGGQIAAAEQKIADHLPELIGKAFELAMGIKQARAKTDPATGQFERDAVTGEFVTELVYTELPDLQAIKFLVERVAGRPPQEVILAGEDGGPIEIQHTHRQQATIELEAWRAEMTSKLSSLPSAPPTAPTSPIPTA